MAIMTETESLSPLQWLPEQRLAPFLAESKRDPEKALELYEWAARMSAACFTTVGHLEVLLRHALDSCLAEMLDEESAGIPWFLRNTPLMSGRSEAVATVRERLGTRESRDQIVANLSFGFWSGMFNTRHDELWKHGLHRALPNGPGLRKNVAVPIEAIRKFRNRLAHHDSILNVDIRFEMERVFSVAGMIHPDAEIWLRGIDDSLAIYAARPVTAFDTVIVPASDALALYEQHSAYVCQPGRHFRDVTRMGFYADSEIKRPVPTITLRRDDVDWSEAHAETLLQSPDREDRKIAQVIQESRRLGWTGGRYQVFLLTAQDDPRTRLLSHPIAHLRRGRGSAFVRKQRYFPQHILETARTTEDLMS